MTVSVTALRRLLLPTAIFVAAFVTFVPGLHGEFVNWDDDVNFLGNPGYRGLDWSHLRWMATAMHEGHWIPLSWLTLGLNYTLGGMDPFGYHLGNLVFHSANSVLFYFVARRLLGSAGAAAGESALSWGAAGAALLFAVHPLRVESVVWMTERRDVQSMFFFLLSALGYLRAVAEGRDGRLDPLWRRLSIAAFVCAFLSKSTTIMLPAALLLLDIYPLGRAKLAWRRLFVEKIPYFLLAATDFAVAWIAVRRAATVTALAVHGLAGRIAIVFYSFFYYPWRLTWPVGLSPLYEMPQRVDPLQPRFLGPFVLLVVITAALVVLRRRWPAGLCAWAYSALMILPLSGLVHIGFQLVQDRWSYLSGLGFEILAGGGIAWLLDARARGRVSAIVARSVMAGAAALLLFLAAASWDQSKVWQDSETLWRWGTNLDPECAVCWNNLGTALIGRKGYGEAEEAYRRVAALRPMSGMLANNIATALHGQRRDAEAVEMLHLAVRLDPNLTGALLNLGGYEAQTGHFAESLSHLRRAYALDPTYFATAKELAWALVAAAAAERTAGHPSEALALYKEALAVQPTNAQAREGVAALLAERPGAKAGGARR